MARFWVFAGLAALLASIAGAAPRVDADRLRALPAPTEEVAESLSRHDRAEEAQRYFLLKRSPDGKTPIAPARYRAAIADARKLPVYSSAAGRIVTRSSGVVAAATWEPLGPGNIGGRTGEVVIDPLSPNTMYVAAASGGVWKTTDGGATWTPLFDEQPNLAVNALAIDPTDNHVLYAGTGEGYFNYDAQRGEGILKSTDAGATWAVVGGTDAVADFHYVNEIVVAPDASHVYAATREGVYRSPDGGLSWTRVLDPTQNNGCMDLAIRTNTGANDEVFASCGNFEQATIYRNLDADGVGSWDPVHSEAGMGRTSLAIAPSDQNYIYGLSASIASGTFRDGLHAVFRSTTGGGPGSWVRRTDAASPTKLNRLLLSNTLFANLAACFPGESDQYYNQGWYDNVIAVDPADRERVWTGGIDLFRSDDGGANWGQASRWYVQGDWDQFAHADQHAIAFHPGYNGTTNRTMFVGNDGGIYRTTDAHAATATGATAPCSNAGAVQWTSLNNGYAVTQFYHGVPLPNGSAYFGGTQDNGTVLGADAGGPDAWTEINGGDGGYVAVDPANPQILYAENTGLSIIKSFDGGGIWFNATNGISGDGGFPFIAVFSMDPANGQRLWTGGWFIWRTTNGGSLWQRASALTPGNGNLSAIASAPSDPNRVVAGLSDGYIVYQSAALSSGSGTVWPEALPRPGYVSSVAFDPANANIAYATYSTFGGNHVWRSIDGGANWLPIDGIGVGQLPDVPVHSIVVDPGNSARLYIGTDIGVFTSGDAGLTWAVENTGFPNVATESLRTLTPAGGTGVAATTNMLYAFTHGRGAYRVTLETPPPPPPPPPPPTPARCVVPNVKRTTVPKAKAALKARKCAAGKIKQAFSGKVKKGRVIAQSKRPGTRHPRNTKVNLTVSKGARKKPTRK